MKIKYVVNNEEVDEKPQNGERYIEERWVDGTLAVVIESVASTEKERLASKTAKERAWRDIEIKRCSELKQEADHPYLAEINAYLQLLRDYPSQDDFPNGERPTRPLTPSGSAIIL